jgi:hypothetical protein
MFDMALELRTIEEWFWFERVVVVGDSLASERGINEDVPIWF